MLIIKVDATEAYDESNDEFLTVGGLELRLEHSLVSLSKWEAEFEKPFLGKDPKSAEEILFYVRAMSIDPEISPAVFSRLSQANLEAINDYIDRKMTATWFSDQPGAPRSSEVITSELVYYWMTVFTIPFECENWHLNRLFTLIRICNIKQSKPKKMSRGEVAARNRELNARRRAQMGTSG